MIVKTNLWDEITKQQFIKANQPTRQPTNQTTNFL